MNVTCPECRSVFRVDPTKVPAAGTRARCAVCGGVMAVDVPAGFAEGRATPLASAAVPPPAMRTPPAAAPAMSGGGWVPERPRVATPPAPPRVTPPAPSAVATPPSVVAAPAVSAPAVSAPVAAPPRPSGGSGRPINPFLSNDPNQKARRLARALVSDMVAYHPQLREQALREGTLKQTFRDEIKKSYEEYVDQIGKEFAESTGHFQEALNEILAAGRKLF